MQYIAGNPRRNLNGEPLESQEAIERITVAEQEIERLHKQDGKSDAPKYFALCDDYEEQE